MIPACKQIRKDILSIAKSSGHGHIPTCFSIVETLYAVYDVMNHRSADPRWEGRDIFVLSKGHGALAHYCLLANLGYFDITRVHAFGAFMSDFGCHADRIKVPGIEVSTGSLGHGIGVAAGIALAFKIKKSPRKVYVLVGDGESNEGSVWEAVLVAVNRGLDNLTVLYDDNRSHSRGLQIHDPVAHFRGFDCDVVEVPGHDLPALKEAIQRPAKGVKVIAARTVKGYGSPTLINDQYAWHRRSPNEEEFNIMMRELDEKTI
ncbi:MAG TPA: 1-deoxy-D-xylulose-5-phosphate synthase N-terminal domain-containing protein [Nitrospirota bacterium]|nr:1-deoxy-D-xylulose-5-phosphate synthase N-terminal domain-containing protein [Nitrospirota bacterium]